MSFFKKFQEKASVLSKVAKEYYEEGMAYAAQEIEKEKDTQQPTGKELKTPSQLVQQVMDTFQTTHTVFIFSTYLITNPLLFVC